MTNTITETQNLLSQLESLSLPRTRPLYAETAKAIMHAQVQDNQHEEVSAEVSNSVETSEPTTEVVVVQKNNAVEFELWETLAYDLALSNTDPQTIANAYDLTIDQLEQLQTNPYFAKILQAKKDEVKQLGSDATFAVKMRMVANRATPQLLRRLTDPNTANRDFLAMFKTVTELGQLIPQPSQDDSPQPTLIGASVTFNISGVPGLGHLSTASQSSQTVIDSVATSVSEVEFDEVVNELSTRQNKYDDELGEL